MRILGLLLTSSFWILVFGCAPVEKDESATHDAYVLLDHSQNAKAIQVLEQELEQHPANDEARLLLSTAYAGLAGIDFYSIYENFQDVLFRRSLKDTVLDPKNENDPRNRMNREAPKPENPATEVEKSLQLLDRSLQSLHSMVIVLNRFPSVPEEKWPYIDHALQNLIQIKPSADLAVYRVFLRLVYLKSYLMVNMIEDKDFGTRRWACSLDMTVVSKNLAFFEEHLNAISADLNLAIRLGAKRLEKVRAGIREFESDPAVQGSIEAIQVGPTAQAIEAKIKDRFSCNAN